MSYPPIPVFLSCGYGLLHPRESADREGEGRDGSDPHFLGVRAARPPVEVSHRRGRTALPPWGVAPVTLILAGRLGVSTFPEADLK